MGMLVHILSSGYMNHSIKATLLNPEQVKNIFKEWGTFACECYNTDKYAESRQVVMKMSILVVVEQNI